LRILKKRWEKERQISMIFIFFSESFNELDEEFGFKAKATSGLL